jgi:hypothetical protein
MWRAMLISKNLRIKISGHRRVNKDVLDIHENISCFGQGYNFFVTVGMYVSGFGNFARIYGAVACARNFQRVNTESVALLVRCYVPIRYRDCDDLQGGAR